MTATPNTEVFARADAPLKSILFVEDNDDDFLIARLQLDKIKLRNPVRHVRTAEELFDYLNGIGHYADRKKYPSPAVIILDMRLPGRDGLAVQAMLRANMKYRTIPIIPIGSPERVTMLKAALDCGANAYLLKPINGMTFKYVTDKIGLPLEFGLPAV
ncbi:MAG: response regulator [Limisphaerales bacterium]